jgi:hypothetical protein
MFTVKVGLPVMMNDRVYYSLSGYVNERVFVRHDDQNSH